MADNWIAGAIKHPGAFSAKAAKAGKSTSAFASEKKDAPGTLGRQARLAQTLSKMRTKKAKFGGVYDSVDKPQPPKRGIRFGGNMACGGMVK